MSPQSQRNTGLSSNSSKQRIATSFGRAVESYDDAARLQRYAAECLWQCLDPSPTLGVAVDLGCGTGLQLSKIQQNADAVIAIDLSRGMLKHAQCQYPDDSCLWLQGDAESLPLLDATVDTLYSNLMVQWCHDLDQALREIYRVLKPGGRAVVSTLLRGSLAELEQAWRSVDDYRHVNDFLSAEHISEQLQTQRFSVARLQVEPLTLEYQRLTALTRELKSVGANVVTENKRKSPLSKLDVQRLLSGYEPFRLSNDKLPATYQIGVLVLQR
ncbi:malonyl-[acyl-carrier protein] O-methyltransferase BioC [Corallincola holothuriorum]|uniref:Malonyl-[acyl-carrier protein] O-methyltransferase n=1 Tax=Corallincola holothuriorum TaxID=2282215 RepID=A0A368NQL8_9GAMM|nr:malonyl-[acyl-carrier protein] O-methyltransferase BioC [Corallincola holothuriorum]